MNYVYVTLNTYIIQNFSQLKTFVQPYYLHPMNVSLTYINLLFH